MTDRFCNSCSVLKISAISIVGWLGWVNILLGTMYTVSVWTSCSIVGGTLLATGQDYVWHFHHTSGSLLSCFRYNVDGWFLITCHLKIRVRITLLGFCIRIADNFGYLANGHCCAISYAQYGASRNNKSGLLFCCRLLAWYWFV